MMELSRRKVLVTFTTLGLASSLLVGFTYFGSFLYSEIYKFILSQEAGGLRRLSWLFESPWTDMLVQYFLAMGIAYIPVYLMLCWLPKDRKPLMKLSAEDFIVCAVASLGLGYLLNFAGTFLNAVIGQFTGKSLLEMNPVVEMTEALTPSMLLYMCVVGPVMEEVMFRGWLLKRARLFGDWTAVLFTAIMFGLMHGNLSQFLYAAVIGLIFGYVAVKTNSIRYTIGLHMVVNTFSATVAVGENLIYETGGEFLSILYLIGVFITILFFIVNACIVVKRYGKYWYLQMRYHDSPQSDNKIFIYLNPGFALYLLICFVDFLSYLI